MAQDTTYVMCYTQTGGQRAHVFDAAQKIIYRHE